MAVAFMVMRICLFGERQGSRSPFQPPLPVFADAALLMSANAAVADAAAALTVAAN